ncbi:MAG: DUF3857 domain-containing protein [Acidobacteria bacterium]|jgi:transglutaminase-like putative cysteine protease/tetratricopeptide (TPR) repeat protein|nr:DUF3857 domain-containing protein [Acidobacteriota bacterium]
MTAFASRRARPHFLRRLARLAVPLVLLAGNFAPHAAAAPATAAAPACFEVWWRTRLAAAGRAADSAERAPDALFAARLVNDLARTAADLDPVLAEMDRLRATVAPHDALVAAEIDAVLLQGDLAAGRRDAAAVRAARLGLVSGWRLAGPFAAGDEPAADDTRLRDAAGPAWRHFAAGPDGAVPLALLMDPAEKTTAFASFYLRAAGPVELAIRFGADDRAELSIDGSAVLRPEGRHDLAFDQHAAFVRLAAGWHRATFRVEQETGAWGLVARVTAPDGGPLPAGVTIALPDDLAAAEREIAARSAAPRLASGRTLPATLEARARRGGPALAQQALDLFQRHLPDRQSDRALTLARQAAATSPGEVETLLVLHDVERDPARQREALDRALAIDPSHPSVLRQLAQYYLGFGQDDVSRATAERSLAACGWPDPYLLGWVTVAENARGFPGGALADLERLTQQFPAQQVLLDRQGSLARRTGRPESARRAWQQYLALQPSHDDVRMALIQLELESGRAARALELTDAAIALDPVGVPWYAQRARLLLADGRPEAALEATARGLAVGPTDPELLILKGESLLALGDGPGAAAAWQAASRALDQDLGLAERIAAVTGVDESFGSEWTQTLEQAQALERERPVAGDPALVVLASTSAYRVREDGQSIRFHQEILRVRHPEQAQSARQHQFAYSPMLQRATVLEARLVRRDGSVLVASRSEQPLLPDPETRMWYDTRVITLSLPRLEEGDLIEFRYRIADRGTANPIGAGYFGEIEFLGQSVPVLASRLVLDTAPSLPVRHRLLHLPAEPRVATETRDGRELTVIDLPPLPAYLSLAASPPPVTRVPYAVLGTAADWDALGRMYARLIEKQAVPDADVRAAAAQATAGARSRRAKIDAIYAWVIENTRYVALEFGIHALKPYDVPSVFRRRFGDCKDKATLMVAMLREVGIPARVVAIRTSDLGIPDTTVPTFAHFNHAIVYVPEVDLYLDGTVLHHGLDETPRMDLGALALIVDEADGGSGRLVTTPRAQVTSAATDYTQTITVSASGSASVRAQVSARGESAAEERTYLRFADDRGAILSSRLRRIYPEISVTDATFGALGLFESPVTYEFEARAGRFALREGNVLRAPLSFFPIVLPVEPVSAGREVPLQLPQPYRMSSDTTFELPAGFALQDAPRAGRIDSAWGTVSLESDRVRGALRIRALLEWRGGEVPVAELTSFSSFVEQARQLLSQPVVLEVAP